MFTNRSRLERGAARAFRLKDYRRAAKRLSELLEYVGENPRTLQTLALCHERMGEETQAFEFARRALAADPEYLPTIKLLTRMHFLRDEQEEVRRFIRAGLEVAARMERDASRPPREAVASSWLARLLDGLTGRAHGKLPREDREWVEWAKAYLQSDD